MGVAEVVIRHRGWTEGPVAASARPPTNGPLANGDPQGSLLGAPLRRRRLRVAHTHTISRRDAWTVPRRRRSDALHRSPITGLSYRFSFGERRRDRGSRRGLSEAAYNGRGLSLPHSDLEGVMTVWKVRPARWGVLRRSNALTRPSTRAASRKPGRPTQTKLMRSAAGTR